MPNVWVWLQNLDVKDSGETGHKLIIPASVMTCSEGYGCGYVMCRGVAM